MKKGFFVALFSAMTFSASAQNAIKVNQIGYYTNESKVAVVVWKLS